MNYAATYITRAIAEIQSALASIDERIAAKQGEVAELTIERRYVATALDTLQSFDASAPERVTTSAPVLVVSAPVPGPKPRTRDDWRRLVLTFLLDGPQPPTAIRRLVQAKDRATTRRKLNAMHDLGLVEATGATHTRRWTITDAGRAWLDAPPEPPRTETPDVEEGEPVELAAEAIEDVEETDDEPEPEPEPPPRRATKVRVEGYKPGHRVERAKTEKATGGPGFWVGKSREQLNAEAARRAAEMSATPQGMYVRGITVGDDRTGRR